MSTGNILAVLCMCGAGPDATVHNSPDGHKYAPIRGADQVRDDQVSQRVQRKGHNTIVDYRVITLANPAAAADWTATVPVPARWRVQCLQAQLVTSAVAANRIPHLVITDGQGRSMYNFPAPGNQPAALTVQYSAGTTIVALQFDNAQALVLPYPMKLLQGWTIGTLTTGLSAGDQWSNIQIHVKEWLQF